MGWLEQHIEEFVMPVVHAAGDVPTKAVELKLPDDTTFTQEELTVIKNVWRSVKHNARGRTVLLPGRDVFIFEILARRENYPTVFIPECSRMTVRYIADHLDEFLPDGLKLSSCFLFDTGFAGSIPRNLRMSKKGGRDWQLMSYQEYGNVDKQVFPRLTMSRSLALKIETTPKYWESGRMANPYVWRPVVSNVVKTQANTWTADITVDVTLADNMTTTTTNNPQLDLQDGVLQPRSNLAEFIRAARLTIAIYTNSAPKFINRHKPLLLYPERSYGW